MFYRGWLLVLALLPLALPCGADHLAEAVKTARAGETITLPAGTFQGGVTLPLGVSLRGAGYGKTIIDAGQAQAGVTVNGGTISDLAVRGARVTGILVKGGANARVSRVRVSETIVGVKIEGVTGARVENTICERDNYGIVITDGIDSAVVNCTLVDCPEIGLNFPSGTGTTAFNNVVTGSSTAVNIGRSEKITLDYNLYFGAFVGIMADQIPRRMLFAWRALSGLDAHSVQMAVRFRDAAQGDFTPVNTLPWALSRAVTADWGVATLGTVAAPETDISGRPRSSDAFDLGAVETRIDAPRPTDGTFTVSDDAGIKSAGVFTKDGILISYLFQNLPLRKGSYAFHMPVRDYTGSPIPAGDYEVRLTESDLRWQYLGHIGDNGGDRGASWSSAVQPGSVAFDAYGGLIMGHGWSEDHTNVRSYDVKTGALRWKLRGASDMRGVTVATDGTVYVLRSDATFSAAGSRLTRLDGETGAIRPWKGAEIIHAQLPTGAGAKQLVEIQGKLITLNPEKNGLDVIDANTATLTTQLLDGVTLLAADAKTGVLWTVRNGVLTALSPDLKTLATHAAVNLKPAALAARNGVLAIASRATGKVHLFDVSNPAKLKSLRTVGTGDGPYGAFRPERFFFKNAPGWMNTICDIALGPNGELAVVDHGRLVVLDKKGKTLWYTCGVFGNQSQLSHGTQYRRLWDTYGDRSFALDEKTGTWTPEGLWDISAVPEARKDWNTQFLGDFNDGGKVFGVYVRAYQQSPHLTIVRYDSYHATPVLSLETDPEAKTLLFRKDNNRDGKIDAADTAQPVLNDDGKPVVANQPFLRFNYLMSNGDLQSPFHRGLTYLWKRSGLDKDGVPVYRWTERKALVTDMENTMMNPYDRKLGGIGQVTKLVSQPDGGWTMQAMLRGSGGAGLNNGGGTDLFGFTADDKLRWVQQLAEYKGLAGLGSANGVTVTAIFYSGEYPAFDPDGLALGGFTEAKELYYGGYWIDHPNMNMYRGRDGSGYVTVGDNANGRHPWYRMIGDKTMVKARSPLVISAEKAQALAALPEAGADALARPEPRRVRVAKLPQPLIMDGSLEKWRAAGVTPQLILGPGSAMDGPGDCSALIRLGYEGQNFYVQVLQFDDVPTFHQGVKASHQQDTVEMCLNGNFPEGFQFCTLKIPDGTDVIVRRRFFSDIKETLLDPEQCPRIVKVLPDASSVSERNLLESIYGADLSKSKVIITEYKLPIDAGTYAPAEKDIFPLGPGKTFWIGFMIDDNDDPGTDFQDFIGWPNTFGAFNPKEDGAIAVCD